MATEQKRLYAVHCSAAVVPVEPAVAADAVTISFVTERSDANGVRTVDVVRALQSDTIQDVKLRLRTRGHRVSNGHALVSTFDTFRSHPADGALPLDDHHDLTHLHFSRFLSFDTKQKQHHTIFCAS